MKKIKRLALKQVLLAFQICSNEKQAYCVKETIIHARLNRDPKENAFKYLCTLLGKRWTNKHLTVSTNAPSEELLIGYLVCAKYQDKAARDLR